MEIPPNVVALPLHEAREILARAGWACREVVETRAPRRSDGGPPAGSAGVGGSSPGARNLLVVRQQVVDAGVVRLTVAAQGDPDRSPPW